MKSSSVPQKGYFPLPAPDTPLAASTITPVVSTSPACTSGQNASVAAVG